MSPLLNKAVGIDFGGTKIRAGLVDRKGTVLFAGEDVATQAEKDRGTVEANLFRSIETVLRHSSVRADDIAGIGIGSPGPLDISTGTILNAPNLPSLNRYHLRQQVHSRFGVPVHVNNDANCFVLGETLFGSGKGASIVAGLTLGTGIGCGVILDGRLFGGSTGTAAEIWCTPYRDKTFEDIVSGKGIEYMYRKRTGRTATAKEIASSAEKRETAALETWDEFGLHLGIVLSVLINVLDPDVIVLGGSLTKAFDFFQRSMEETYRTHINALPRAHVRIERSRLGDLAGLIGAASLCFG